MAGKDEKRRVAYEYTTVIGLTLLAAISLIITVVLAATGSNRMPLMVAVSLVFLFLIAINRIRIRTTFTSIRRDRRLRRKAHAAKGIILKFPEQGNAQDQDLQQDQTQDQP